MFRIEVLNCCATVIAKTHVMHLHGTVVHEPSLESGQQHNALQPCDEVEAVTQQRSGAQYPCHFSQRRQNSHVPSVTHRYVVL
jgi:hypothetical protein